GSTNDSVVTVLSHHDSGNGGAGQSGTKQSIGKGLPQTDEKTNTASWWGIMILGIMGFLGTLFTRKNRQKQ
ncbi:LPXTG cell wall anchor domain-containing protein, partial [Lactiplantibacillus plantarum]